MLNKIDDNHTAGEYLWFKDLGYATPTSITRKFSINSRNNGSYLGVVKWSAPWRRYVYATCGVDCEWDSKCMKELQDFCTYKTEEHKASR